jgi:hypothetical protein
VCLISRLPGERPGHRAGTVEIAEPGERFDQLRDDGEHPGICNALTLGVLVDGAEIGGRRQGIAREQRRGSPRTKHLKPNPAVAVSVRPADRLTGNDLHRPGSDARPSRDHRDPGTSQRDPGLPGRRHDQLRDLRRLTSIRPRHPGSLTGHSARCGVRRAASWVLERTPSFA